jgi:2-polyprenyl-3-methyl-5-hydroxy-6-metoxy-1,4-benzoquinol methylase
MVSTLDSVRCLVCGSFGFSILLSETKFKKLDSNPGQFIVRCNHCGIVTRHPSLFDPQFDKEQIIELRTHRNFIGGKEGAVAQYLVERLTYATRMVRNRTLLDIGCGSGALLIHAKANGWEVVGTEHDSELAANLNKYDIKCISGGLDDSQLEQGQFDFIHMNHVLEHVMDPVGTLQAIKRLLNKQGIVIIEVPNEFLGLFQMVRRLMRMDGSSTTSYFQHEWFFSMKTLAYVCKKAGLKITKITTPYRKSSNTLRNVVALLVATVGLGDVIEIHLSRD